ncbi:hypothetical protein BDQ12DRAFT_721516 [Crucibulum laeve]|uniref:Uncharacterized protein n=1 Tax=Crucibulum laeve TaxID=68775 RepID=A0A5C3M863_9AGAR|nr:hypothetical protein BDQ12DRAFT_721516 [Crucibulum laeve]
MPELNLLAARMSYAASVIRNIGYGVYLLLTLICLKYQMQRRQRNSQHWLTLAFTLTMLVINTASFIVMTMFTGVIFVEHGKTDLDFRKSLYRTNVVWGGRLGVIIVPVMMYIATLGLGGAFVVLSSQPGITLNGTSMTCWATAFYSLSISLTMLSTLLIATKLLLHQRRNRALLDPHDNRYSAIVAIFVESAALYTIFGIMFIICFSKDTPLQYPASSLFNIATGIAPNLIVLRMALGVAYTNDSTLDTTMSIRFRSKQGYRPRRSLTINFQNTHPLSSLPSRLSLELEPKKLNGP